MFVIKQQIKKIIGIFSISAILTSVIIGISIKTKSNLNNGGEDNQARNEQTGIVNPDKILEMQQTNPKICRDIFEENENDISMRGYTEKDVVDCMTVGCGGIF